MNKIGLVISREFNVRVRKKSFIVMTILMPLLMVLLVTVPTLVAMYSSRSNETKTIVVVDNSNQIYDQLHNTREIVFQKSESKYPSVVTENPDAYGYLIIGSKVVENPNTVQLYSRKNTTIGLQNQINSQISRIITAHRIAQTNIEGLEQTIQRVSAHSKLSTYAVELNRDNNVEQRASSSYVAIGAGYISGFVIYMFILMYGMMVLQGVVEEKSNRIVEVIVSSVRPFELMMGKILGIAMVAILQFLVWAVIAGVLLLVVMPVIAGVGGSAGAVSANVGDIGALPQSIDSIVSVLSNPMYLLQLFGGFIVFFVGGYLLYAAMFAAVGSAVESVTDTQQMQVPVTIPLIIALVLMMNAMQDPYSSVAFWGSMIPFTSPIIMMVRVAYGVSWWEFLLSVSLLYGTFVGVTYLAAKIYRTGIFMYGKKPSFVEILRWLRR